MADPAPAAIPPLAAPVRRLRHLGWCEGVSFLVLLATTPLKHRYGILWPTRIVGSLHGALFLAYVVLLALAAYRRHWPVGRIAVVFLASVVPFGPFLLDARLRRWEAEPG